VLGHGAGHYLVGALLWSTAIVVVFGAIATARFRRS
jgi:hypothetical protein